MPTLIVDVNGRPFSSMRAEHPEVSKDAAKLALNRIVQVATRSIDEAARRAGIKEHDRARIKKHTAQRLLVYLTREVFAE